MLMNSFSNSVYEMTAGELVCPSLRALEEQNLLGHLTCMHGVLVKIGLQLLVRLVLQTPHDLEEQPALPPQTADCSGEVVTARRSKGLGVVVNAHLCVECAQGLPSNGSPRKGETALLVFDAFGYT